MMNWKEIKAVLDENEYREVIRAIFSFESGLNEVSKIDELIEIYLNTNMPNFLDQELYFKTIELENENK